MSDMVEILHGVIDDLKAENARLKEEHEASVTGYEIACDILADEREALRAENARLREALKPIIPDKVLDEEEYSLVWNFHLNAARAAIGEEEN